MGGEQHFTHFIRKGKGKAPHAKREKGKGGSPLLGSNSTRLPYRARARTNETKRNNFPVGLAHQPPIFDLPIRERLPSTHFRLNPFPFSFCSVVLYFAFA